MPRTVWYPGHMAKGRRQLEALAAEGAQFDVVICDPPAFAPTKQALEAGLRAYERVAKLAAPLVAPGGYLGLCSCSHAADLSSFRNASARGSSPALSASRNSSISWSLVCFLCSCSICRNSLAVS